ncbi:uncharacterized protein LOC119615846 [Lucilia sericata]|uniref:uncharacterized protein LOC119615846 n=1 Tax=Lucilia sericata TaxID=13632 RepID=UPI0018A87418|nr:uncharacterized protein LOC119615846 [Lucilia sericata]
MVELTGSSSPFQQSIPNLVFYVPAVVVFGLAATFFGDVERIRKHFIVVLITLPTLLHTILIMNKKNMKASQN